MSPTRELLAEAEGYFGTHLNVNKGSSTPKDEHGRIKFRRKVFGKAPWHRKESGDSVSTVTSSVGEILRGGTPPATPTPRATSCKLFETAWLLEPFR